MTPTLFDLYAAAALQGILASTRDIHADQPIAVTACNFAEQMLKERAKRLPLDLDGDYADDDE